ncbi:MAG: hypothetical protein ACLUOI_09755 [Eisenbergiella sp.]
MTEAQSPYRDERGEYYIKCKEQFMRLEKNMDAYFKDMADLNTGHLSVGSSSFSVLTFWRDF